MTYPEALDYLSKLNQFGFQPGLETTEKLAAAVGNPHRRLRFIHVAGTNGKGSTCAFLANIYRKAGLKVGLYTSPHLVRFGERIQVNGMEIPDNALAGLIGQLAEKVAAMAPPLQPTFFEFTTVLALQWYDLQGCDVIIWETGLGGRLDSTNIVEPLASVITQIGLDHQKVLGATLPAIAYEKAGIIKPGVPILTAADAYDARAVIEYRAKELDAPYIYVDEPATSRIAYAVGLRGQHQRRNAALAATTARLLRPILPVSDDQIRAGLETVTWPGRLQTVRRGNQTILLDGAHNLDGVRSLITELNTSYVGQRPTMIVGMLADKEWRTMVQELVPNCSRLLATPVGSSRTVGAEEIRGIALATGLGRPARTVGSVAEALRMTQSEPFVVITGSLYLIGEAMVALGLRSTVGVAEQSLNDWTKAGCDSASR